MRNRPGKIYGQAGLIVMTAALIALIGAGGVAVGLTHGRIRDVGKAIKRIEDEQKKLKDDNRFIAEKLARVTDSISLRQNVSEVLQSPTPDQVVQVRRRTAPTPVMMRAVPRDPRFAALDIAFIQSAPASGSATVR